MQIWPRIEKQILPMKKKQKMKTNQKSWKTVPLGKNQKKEIENRRGVRKQFHCNKLNPRWIKEESETTSVSR
jgi:hypothetical protein